LRKREAELAEKEAKINALLQHFDVEQSSLLQSKLSTLTSYVSIMEHQYNTLKTDYERVCDDVMEKVQTIRSELEATIENRVEISEVIRSNIDKLEDNLNSNIKRGVDILSKQEEVAELAGPAAEGIQGVIDKAAGGIEYSLDKIGDGIILSIDKMIKPFAMVSGSAGNREADRQHIDSTASLQKA
jgi:hypothetical protein